MTAIFGIESDFFTLTVNLVLLFLVILWIALIYFTYADARRRIADPILVWCATAASLFPFAGTIVYMIVRPPEYLEDARERELEIQAAEARLFTAGLAYCPKCDGEVRDDYLRCPACATKLRDACAGCSKPLDPDWRICPYCETEVVRTSGAPRRRQRLSDEPDLLEQAAHRTRE
jgi:hypothetical protein